MNIQHRFELAFGSQLGVILFALMIALCLLLALYWALTRQKHKIDSIAFEHKSYFTQAEELASLFAFASTHKLDFFGRQTIVKSKQDGSYALCTIPSPLHGDLASRERFQRYHRATQHQKIPLLSELIWKHDQDSLVIIQDKIIRKSGRLRIGLSEYLLDHRLGVADCELVLLELSLALAKLHDIATESGEGLYHGFLLPRSLYLGLDSQKRITRLVVADAPFAISFGSERLYEMIQEVKQEKADVKSDMEHTSRQTLLKQLPMLAPEQQSPEGLSRVGPPCDFFAFGALAVTLFTHHPFSSPEDIIWKDVPPAWQAFLKKCLEFTPSNRPQDFLEIQDRLTDPDLALTHVQTQITSKANQAAAQSEMAPAIPKIQDTLEGSKEIALNKLSSTIESLQQRLQQARRAENYTEAEELAPNIIKEISEKIISGMKALKNSRLQPARGHFDKAIELAPHHPEAHVGLAIVYYEEGDLKQAEYHYLMAKQMAPYTAKIFRDYIAFHI